MASSLSGRISFSLLFFAPNITCGTFVLPDFPFPSSADLLKPLELIKTSPMKCNANPASVNKSSKQLASLCAHFSLQIEEQLDVILASSVFGLNKFDHIVWTIVDDNYVSIAADQNAQVMNLGFPPILFISVDVDASVENQLCSEGLATLSFRTEFGLGQLDMSTKLRVAKAKFTMPHLFIKRQLAALFTEMDVFWIRNPRSLFTYRPPYSRRRSPSVIIGTHYDNAWSPNIGMWYIPRDASSEVGNLFLECLQIMRRHSSVERLHDPYDVHDQHVLQMLLRGTQIIPRRRGSRLRAKGCDQVKLPYCDDVNRSASRWKDIVVRLLDNTVVSSWLRPAADANTVAVHILGRAPLHDARTKVTVAKLHGVFIGQPSYYEVVPSRSQYLGWDGIISAMSEEHGYCAWPRISAKRCGIHLALPFLIGLALGLKRVLLLPRQLDLDARQWASESIFDVGALYQEASKQLFPAFFRESVFFQHRFLVHSNLYPIARIWINNDGWVGAQVIESINAMPWNRYWSIDSSSFSQVLNTFLTNQTFKRAKTILVRLPLRRLEPSRVLNSLLPQHHGRLRPACSRLLHVVNNDVFFCDYPEDVVLEDSPSHFSICTREIV